MKRKIRSLSLVVQATLALLSIGATLVVIGIFDVSLDWDIFGPKSEAILYGVFASSLALAGFGVAATLVLGIQQIVRSLNILLENQSSDDILKGQESGSGKYFLYIMGIIILLVILIIGLAIANHYIQIHRNSVFEKLAYEQMNHFEDKLAEEINILKPKAEKQISQSLYDLMVTLRDLSFINNVVIFVVDPEDITAMLKYQPKYELDKSERFKRSFVAKDAEKIIIRALKGNDKYMEGLNKEKKFAWYYLIKDQEDQPIAVLKIIDNQRESFREYNLK